MKTFRFHRSLQGFTLIELLVVITIIAVLAGIALPAYNSVIKSGRMVKDMSNLRQMGASVMLYQGEHNNTMISSGSNSYWIMSGSTKETSSNDMLWPNYMPTFAACQSPFDHRTASESPLNAPISYSFNTNTVVLSGTGWNGNRNALHNASKLILLAPNYPLSSGTPTEAAAWGSDTVNIPLSVNNLPVGGVGMKSAPYANSINIFFADGHGEKISFADFQDSTSANGILRWIPQ